jgi:hypothetical protein
MHWLACLSNAFRKGLRRDHVARFLVLKLRLQETCQHRLAGIEVSLSTLDARDMRWIQRRI